MFTCGVLGRAESPLIVLNAPVTSVARGSVIRIELVVFNASEQPLSYSLPAQLAGRLTRDGLSFPITLHAEIGTAQVPAGGFTRIALDASLPATASGRLVLELDQPGPVRTVIDVAESGVTALPADAVAPGGAALRVDSSGRLAESRFKHYYADHFSAHEPIYFVYGGSRPAAKFQFSFKYRLLNDDGPLATRFPELKGLHLAYTQRSLWDITGNSSPFYDSSYMPELLFESLAQDTGKHEGFTWLGYQLAAQHESNGRDGAASRSMNTFYFRPMMVFGDPEGWRLILLPKFFVDLTPLDDNPDLRKYRGYSELRVVFGKANRLSVSVIGRVGKDFDKGSAQVDVTYPTEFLTGNFAMYLDVQGWTGYGESLLTYAKRSSAVRVGFSLAR